MDFAVRKARAEDGEVDDDLGTFLAIVDSSTGCMRAISAETEGATDCRASSVADFVEHLLFVGRFRLRCGKRKCLDQSGGGKYTTIQFYEQRPRRASNARQIGEQLRTLRYDTQNRCKTRITLESTVWPWLVRHAGFCVTRYARGAGGITPFRAYDRDYTQEIVPFAKTALFKIMAPEHRGLLSGRRLYKGDTAWENGIWLGKSETNLEHIVGTRKLCNGSENDPKTGADETLRNFIVARDTRSTPRDLVPNAPRRGRRKRHPTLAPVLPPVHGDPTDDKSSSSSDSTSSSSSTQAQGEIPRHVTVRVQAQIPEVNSRQRWGRMFLLYLPRMCCRQRLRKLIPGRPHRPSGQLNL